MGAYILRRFLYMILLVGFTTVVSFAIIALPPGDYLTSLVSRLESQGGDVTDEQVAALKAAYGLGDPTYVQYFKWVRGLVTEGDLGRSFAWRAPVSEVIMDRLPMTLLTSLGSTLVVYLIAIPIGIYSAVRQYSIGDYIATIIGFIGLAVPNFLLALLVLYFGFAYFNTNIGGLFSPAYVDAPWSGAKLVDMLKHLPIPAVILGIAAMAQAIRIMRANLLDELRKPYVVTARAKGLSEWRAILKYPVRVALNPFASTIGYTLPYVVSGSIIVSLVLGLPTVGPLLLKALIAQDMFLAGTIVLLLGVMTVIGTFLSDLILMWIDPRIRLEG